MKNFAHIVPLFESKDGKPFVYWNPTLSRLMIFHGKRLTVICYNKTDVPPHPVQFIRFGTSGEREQLIYNNGRPVASYLPEFGVIVVKRDGDIFSFDAGLRPLGYASGVLFDTPEKTFPGLAMRVQ